MAGVKITALGLGLAMLVHTRSADACSCGDLGFTAPAAGATDVPTNTDTLYLETQDLVPGATDFELVQWNTQTVVSLTVIEDESIRTAATRFAVGGALDPSAPYYIRERGAEGPATLLFTTGAASDTTPPAAPTLTDFAIRNELYPGSDCSTKATLVSGTVAAPDAVVVAARFDAAGVTRGTYYYPTTDPWNFSSGCDTSIDLATNADVTITLWSEDAAGNRSPEVTAQARVSEVTIPVDGDDDGGGCAAGGTGAGALLGVLALLRRRR
jgi:hypothetical protein